jgi:hypothetical protein
VTTPDDPVDRGNPVPYREPKVRLTDYLCYNSGKTIGGLLGPFGQIETQSAEQAHLSTAKMPMRAARWHIAPKCV